MPHRNYGCFLWEYESEAAFRASHQPPDQDECFVVNVADELVEDALYLEDTLPVIIAYDLSNGPEDQILDVLRKRKSALDCSIAELKDKNPSICIPRIPSIDAFTPSRGMQDFYFLTWRRQT